MSKIARKTQKILAGSAANIGVFGSLQDGSKVLSTDPATIQGTHWTAGMSAAVVSGQNLPALEEINGINYVETYQLAYLFQEGIAEYDAGTTYFLNSIVKAPGTYQLYGSKIDNNIGNALTVGADWQFLCDLSNPESNIVFGTAGGTANALTLTPISALAAYATPTIALVLPTANNAAGGTTINISGLGAKNITKGGSTALAVNDLESGKLVMAIYDGTQFQLINNPAFAHGSDVASAGTMVLNGTGGDIVNITGTTTITAITLNEGRLKVCKFAGAATLTYGASLLLNTGGTNYTTAANDVVIFYGLASGVVVGMIIPASGKSPISPASPSLRTFLSQTSGNFTTSANITTNTHFRVTLLGGGSGASGNTAAQRGNGGNAGGQVIHDFTGLSPSTAYAYTIGAAGTGGAAGANAGTAGGNSTLTWVATTLTANGGFATSATAGTTTSGGTATGGSVANLQGAEGGGGGDSNSDTSGGSGAGSLFGTGGGGKFGFASSVTGNNANNPGSGGGAAGNNASASSAGGNGAAGAIQVQWIE